MTLRRLLLAAALMTLVAIAPASLADDIAPLPFLDAQPVACPQAATPSVESPAVTEADLFLVFHPPQFANDAGARPIVIGGGQCNQTVCGSGQFCCNYSCSVCAPIGGACLDVYCPPES